MLVSRTALLVAGSLSLSLAAGCTSNVDGTTGGDGGAGQGGGAAATAGAGGVFDPGGKVTVVDTSVGPFPIASGDERTQCVVVNLKNPEGAFVRRFRATLNAASHHMIVYRSTQTTEQLKPVDCASFGGLLFGEHPIFIAQQANAELVFPNDEQGTPVALEIAPNQMVKLEIHYINTTSDTMDATGTIALDTLPLGSNVVRSDLAFWGTDDIDIAPNSKGDTGVRFQKALPDTRTFALTTHQHQLGTRMRVWHADNKNDTSADPVADGKDWHDPPLELFSPPLRFGDGGKSGFAYQCEWNNTTSEQIGFGEGFNDEMCFLWHYYFPSQGFQICFNGFCKKTD